MRKWNEEKETTSRVEYDLIANLKPHPYIIGAKEFIATVSHIYIILEYAQGKELQ